MKAMLSTDSAIVLSSSIVVPIPAAVRLKRWIGCFNPPTRAEAPKTGSTLPMIDPVKGCLDQIEQALAQR